MSSLRTRNNYSLLSYYYYDYSLLPLFGLRAAVAILTITSVVVDSVEITFSDYFQSNRLRYYYYYRD